MILQKKKMLRLICHFSGISEGSEGDNNIYRRNGNFNHNLYFLLLISGIHFYPFLGNADQFQIHIRFCRVFVFECTVKSAISHINNEHISKPFNIHKTAKAAKQNLKTLSITK